MYSKSKKITMSLNELSNYIEGYDVYNSQLIEILQTPGLQKDNYEITVYQYRPDLIAEDFYGSKDYTGVLMLQSGLVLTNFSKGTILKLIPKETLDRLLAAI